MTRYLRLLFVPGLLAAQDDGFRPVIGGLPFDSGVALGVEYRKSRLGRGMLDLNAKAIGSVKKYEFLEVGAALPRMAGGLLFADLRARYRNYPEEDFWGLGHKSPQFRRTTYRLEDMSYRGEFGVRPKPWLETGFAGGVLAVNTGPGKDRDHPSIEEWFTVAEAPGLEQQPHYRHFGAFLRADRRDQPGDPRGGGLYEFTFTGYQDSDFHRYSFQRYRADVRQYISVFSERDTIALRAVMALTGKERGQQVPYFLQPTVGGGGDLRGYLQYRFRDENALVINTEYRWRVREIIHVVGFADAGRVFPRPGKITLAGVRGSAGAGWRFKLGESILFGMDLGWSPDGPRVWFRGSHTF